MIENKYINVLNDSVRRYFDEESTKWYFSIVDIIGIVAKTSDPRNYWKVLKNRLKKGQNQLVTSCNQLKMEASDGKFYLNDVADAGTMLKIIELVEVNGIPYFETWFDTFRDKKGPNMLSIKKTLLSPNNEEKEAGKEEEDTYPQLEERDADFELIVDMYRTNDNIIIKAFVAGADIKDIKINLTSLSVNIEGERERQRDVAKEDYQEREIIWGKFSRFLELPLEVETNNLEATEMHGMLTIKLPILDKTQTKKIKVQFS